MVALLESAALELNQLLYRGVRAARQRGTAVVVSRVEPTTAFDPIEVFERGQRHATAVRLWSQPSETFSLVGVGAAFTLTVGTAGRFRQAARRWQELTQEALVEGLAPSVPAGPLLLGGFAFDEQLPATALWAAYPAGQLVLPQLLFTQTETDHWLTWNAVIEPDSDVVAEYAKLMQLREGLVSFVGPYRRPSAWPNARPGPRSALPQRVLERVALRAPADWQAEVAQAAQLVRQGALEKVVLARAVQLQAQQPFQAASALRHLAAHYAGCYIFAIANGAQCFLGATPEQLVRLRDNQVSTMALAGSIQRGGTSVEDYELGQELLSSTKDRHEHAIVVRAVVEALGETCLGPQYHGVPTLLKLGNIQHLYTPIVGKLANGYTLLDLVERLHPTPAVGGRPREAALAIIRACEKLDRGWYAGPVGWLDAGGEGEFAVALRSALLAGSTATLFAGCGIMADSDPEREYVEADLKLNPMLRALANA